MHGIILHKFDFWADPVVHLLLLSKELHEQTERLVGRTRGRIKHWLTSKISS